MTFLPPYLEEGDTVLIISTARARSEPAIAPAIEILNAWGLRVEVGRNAYKTYHQFAGTDEERTQDLQWAINHPTAKAILLSGGGYGSLRIIDAANFLPILKHPKWVVGYSDTTVLHSRLTKMGIACIHGTMAFQFGKNEHATHSVKKLLFGEGSDYDIKPHALNRPGITQAEVVGGNLSLLYALSGSRDEINTKNKILFIEDLDEQLYHIDRMMIHLKRSNKLTQLAALVVGGMTEMKDNSVPFGMTAQEIIWDAVKEYGYPVCFEFPAGHIETNIALYLGCKANLQVSPLGVKFSYLNYGL
ncbi:MAG: LD-carboxypeptidase [bacterium]|nr:LD-carboxypeptidase [bacterium]